MSPPIGSGPGHFPTKSGTYRNRRRNSAMNGSSIGIREGRGPNRANTGGSHPTWSNSHRIPSKPGPDSTKYGAAISSGIAPNITEAGLVWRRPCRGRLWQRDVATWKCLKRCSPRIPQSSHADPASSETLPNECPKLRPKSSNSSRISAPGATLDNGWTSAGQFRSSPGSPGVNLRNACRAMFRQLSCYHVLSVMGGLQKAADITKHAWRMRQSGRCRPMLARA